jgi:hypothetical protein
MPDLPDLRHTIRETTGADDTSVDRLVDRLLDDEALEVLLAQRGYAAVPERLLDDLQPSKLRHIARSLDLSYRWLLDLLDRQRIEIQVDGAPLDDTKRETLIELFSGTEEQDDLRSWADRIAPFHPDPDTTVDQCAPATPVAALIRGDLSSRLDDLADAGTIDPSTHTMLLDTIADVCANGGEGTT